MHSFNIIITVLLKLYKSSIIVILKSCIIEGQSVDDFRCMSPTNLFID